mmetsp:Transcript_9453/g.33248  ORF Transcript_9453/g.33248 Transcript_9453/m.33248 type:complete len:212 (-) Transcript_9453:330-965(-)
MPTSDPIQNPCETTPIRPLSPPRSCGAQKCASSTGVARKKARFGARELSKPEILKCRATTLPQKATHFSTVLESSMAQSSRLASPQAKGSFGGRENPQGFIAWGGPSDLKLKGFHRRRWQRASKKGVCSQKGTSQKTGRSRGSPSHGKRREGEMLATRGVSLLVSGDLIQTRAAQEDTGWHTRGKFFKRVFHQSCESRPSSRTFTATRENP